MIFDLGNAQIVTAIFTFRSLYTLFQRSLAMWYFVNLDDLDCHFCVTIDDSYLRSVVRSFALD